MDILDFSLKYATFTKVKCVVKNFHVVFKEWPMFIAMESGVRWESDMFWKARISKGYFSSDDSYAGAFFRVMIWGVLRVF